MELLTIFFSRIFFTIYFVKTLPHKMNKFFFEKIVNKFGEIDDYFFFFLFFLPFIKIGSGVFGPDNQTICKPQVVVKKILNLDHGL